MKKKLNLIKLVLANVLITLIFILVLMLVPNKTEINFIVCMIYLTFSVLFNIFITEGVE